MNDRIIAKERYKKVEKKSVEKKKNKISNMYNINGKLKKKKKRESIFSLTIVKIFLIIIAIIILGIISRIIIKNDTIPIIAQFFDDITNNLEKGYNLKVGVTADNVPIFKSRNLLLNDIYNIGTKRIVKVSEDYTYEKQLAKDIIVEDGLIYNITLDNNYKITAENLKTTIYRILSNSENIYYQRLQAISDIKVISEYEIQIVLKEKNPYFIYYLDFPVYMDSDILENVKNIDYSLSTNSNTYSFKNNNTKGSKPLSSTTISSYNLSSDMIENFKDNKLDIISVSSSSVEKLIGKYDYSMKKYRDGESLFLLGNKDSEIFKLKEIRQALLYSINREEIIKSLNNSYLELIDLPYIYSKIFYKYDITAANNILLSNGWIKESGIYKKDGKQAILKLVVNSEDNIKCNIAEQIKQMAELNGIRINIEKLDNNSLNNTINSGDYDIVLANVYMDETPDINYLKKHINISSIINENLDKIDNSDLNNISENVSNLQSAMSSEVACIGIYATNTALVYQKYISGFDDISYMNVFKNLGEIGKLK